MEKINIKAMLAWSVENKRLLDATSAGNDERLWKYLHCGAYINYRGVFGETALHRAIYNRKLKLTKQILSLPGIDVNVKNFCFNTPLIEACHGGYTPFVTVLLDAGANPYIEGWAGQKAIDAARSKGFEDIVEILENHKFKKAQMNGILEESGQFDQQGHQEDEYTYIQETAIGGNTYLRSQKIFAA